MPRRTTAAAALICALTLAAPAAAAPYTDLVYQGCLGKNPPEYDADGVEVGKGYYQNTTYFQDELADRHACALPP